MNENLELAAALVAGSTVDPDPDEVLHFADWGGILCGEESAPWTIDESVFFEHECPKCKACEDILYRESLDIYHFAPALPGGLMPSSIPGFQETLCGVQGRTYYTRLADFLAMPVAKCPACQAVVAGLAVAMGEGVVTPMSVALSLITLAQESARGPGALLPA